MDNNGLVQMSLRSGEEFNSSTVKEMTLRYLSDQCRFIYTVFELKKQDETTRASNAKSVSTKLHAIREWQNEETNMVRRQLELSYMIARKLSVPTWEYFHKIFIGFDACILIRKTMDLVVAENRKYRLIASTEAEDITTDIRNLCNDFEAATKTTAARLRQSLWDENSPVDELVYDIISRPEDTEEKDPIASRLRQLFGQDNEIFVRGFESRLRQSWEEGLRAVEKFKSV